MCPLDCQLPANLSTNQLPQLKEAVAAAEQELEAELSRLGVEEAALRVAAGCVEEEMGALEEAQASLGSARRACAGRKEELAQVQVPCLAVFQYYSTLTYILYCVCSSCRRLARWAC